MLALIWAGLCEALCVIAGLIAFWLTGKNTWIAIGIVAGLGFSLPAAIRYYREVKERNRASR
ncbi:MAG: hypothetical protein SGJ21_11945 [Alphaproteobacteria bacterium]|nr:hypothetical protein [Alphaproteobacteria bacterium]